MIGLAVVTASGITTVWLLAPGEADRLREENEALTRQTFELQRAVERLTGEARMAEVHVIEQVFAGQPVNGQPSPTDQTTIEFIELDREGHPLPGRRFTLQDDVIFFDALVIRFHQELVAAGDALRGKSLALFRRVYGEAQSPTDGFAIDPAGDVPDFYRVEPEPSPFERELWARFWDLARNPELAASQGVEVAQGEAVYVPMRQGDVWSLTLQNNGGLKMKLRRSDARHPARLESQPPVN
ncbi:MAG: hypothetical protein AMXMBFR13_31450 [Phycisphaerae bacterium]